MMNKFGSKTDEAVANNSGAMEQRPLKNGRNLKSHMSRINISLWICVALFTGIIVFSGCENDPSKLGKKMGKEACKCAKIKNEEKRDNCLNKISKKEQKLEQKLGVEFEEAFEKEFDKCERLFR
jgi:hypothetical protein